MVELLISLNSITCKNKNHPTVLSNNFLHLGEPSSATSWLETFPGSVLGVTAGCSHSNNTGMSLWVKTTPMSSLVLETDSPYMPPKGVGRKVSLPTDIYHVATAVARIKQCKVNSVLECSLQNIKIIYKL